MKTSKNIILGALIILNYSLLFGQNGVQIVNNTKTEKIKLETPKTPLENTLGIIKPEAVREGRTGEIIKAIELNGFNIKQIKKVKLSEKQAQKFYKEHKGKPFYSNLVSYMTSGPIVALELEKENAIKDWRDLMGATNPSKASVGTIRKMFGKSIEENSVHGSDSKSASARELKFFFS